MQGETVAPDQNGAADFDRFMEKYNAGLPIERAAVDNLK